MRKLGLILMIISLFSLSSYSQEPWVVVDVAPGEKPSIDISPDDRRSIGFINESGFGFLKVANIMTDTITIEDVTTGSLIAGPISLKHDNIGGTRIAYRNDLSRDITIARKLTNTWTIDDIPTMGHEGFGLSMVLTGSRTHIATIDTSVGIEYITSPNSITWEVNQPPGFVLNHQGPTDILVDQSDQAHIAHSTQNNDLRYLFFDNTNWNIQNINTRSKYPSIYFDDNNQVNVAYLKRRSDTTATLHVSTFFQTTWSTTTVDTLKNVNLNLNNKSVSAKYVNGVAHIAYGDTKSVNLAKHENNRWITEKIVDHAMDSVTLGSHVSMALDSDFSIYIAYSENVDSLSEGSMVKYAFQKDFGQFLFDCPADTSIFCHNPMDTLPILDQPIPLINAGDSLSINYMDNTTRAACNSQSDITTRSWTMTNELGQESSCSQMIEQVYFDSTLIVPPEDLILRDPTCYDDIIMNPPDSIHNICSRLDVNFVDTVLTNNCQNEINILRKWTVSDGCDSLLYEHEQDISLRNHERLRLDSLVVINPDDGSNSGSIDITPICGAGDYRFFWSNGESSEDQTNLREGSYNVIVSDKLGCLHLDTFQVGFDNTPSDLIRGRVERPDNGSIVDFTVELSFLDSSNHSYQVLPGNGNESFVINFDNPREMNSDVRICISKQGPVAEGISIIDVVKAQRILLGLVNPCSYNLLAADVNGSGTINIADLVLMKRVIIGIDNAFPLDENWRFYDANTSTLTECIEVKREDMPIDNLRFIGVQLGRLFCEDN